MNTRFQIRDLFGRELEGPLTVESVSLSPFADTEKGAGAAGRGGGGGGGKYGGGRRGLHAEMTYLNSFLFFILLLHT